MGESNFEELVKNESDSDNEELVYEKKKNMIKIPNIKNKITRCFLDMYRFRPNATVTNYVSSNQKNQKK